MSTFSTTITDTWLSHLAAYNTANRHDDPNYYVSNPAELVSTSNPVNVKLGTGAQLFSSLIPALISTQQELLFVTCFWARSESQAVLSTCLSELSARALKERRNVRVRICFSSVSIAQKLFQTSSLSGKEWPPSTWPKVFGLPPPHELTGLDLSIKSLFVLPFSVMHPKFIVIDRKHAFLPSCNVSWENWLEVCIEVRGPFVETLLLFFQEFWEGQKLPTLPKVGATAHQAIPGQAMAFPLAHSGQETTEASTRFSSLSKLVESDVLSATTLDLVDVPTILLPSPHHRNPNFRPLPYFFDAPPPPPTPLNTFVLSLIASAKESIYIQTPNLTCLPVLSALLSALQRGVAVTIVVSSLLMLLEQIATAGTFTELCIWRLRRDYMSLQRQVQPGDPEAGHPKLGSLNISYYKSKPNGSASEPVKSHLKLTIVDGEVVILGSGNMDRASFYTSQELGVTFYSADLAGKIKACVDASLLGRLNRYCS